MVSGPQRRQARQEGGDTVVGPQTVQVSPEELAELRALGAQVKLKKAKSKAKSAARGELIKRYKSEFDKLVIQFTEHPKS